MLDTTKLIHAEVGESLGFAVRTEVSDSLLRLRLLNEAYRPRIDRLWSVLLDHSKREAIACKKGCKKGDTVHYSRPPGSNSSASASATFLGRPSGRRLASSPRSWPVSAIQAA
jgi:hypothetical protein